MRDAKHQRVPRSKAVDSRPATKRTLMIRLRRTFFTGILLLLPLLITITIFYFLFNIINAYVSPLVTRLIDFAAHELFGDPATPYMPLIKLLRIPVGVLITLLVIFGVGLLGTNIIGKRILRMFDRLMLRIPLVRGIYGASQQFMQFLNVSRETAFSRVVLVEYPRRGLFTMGFLTTDYPGDIDTPGGQSMCNVFIPTTPNPTSGWLTIVPRGDVRMLDMTVEDGVKFIISGGIVGPERIRALDDDES